MIKAITVRRALEAQENRKREFVKRLTRNLAIDDPKQRDRLVNEFKILILGRGHSTIRVQSDRPRWVR